MSVREVLAESNADGIQPRLLRNLEDLNASNVLLVDSYPYAQGRLRGEESNTARLNVM
jgi:hypothetical protein